MKTIKKLMTLVLSIAMVLAMGVTAFAANITINGGKADGSTYKAYKLLDATDGGGGKFAYTVNKKYKSALQTVTKKTEDSDIIAYIAELKGAAIQTFADNIYVLIKSSEAEATTQSNTFTGVEQGYYLIAESATSGGTDTYSLVMLDTAGKDIVDVKTKESVPELVKKVIDVNDSDGSASNWQDSADADVGDVLDYKLQGTVSSQIDNYKTYYYAFHDVMTYLTYVDDSVKVYINTSGATDGTDYAKDFDISWDADNKKLSVSCEDLKKVATITADTKVVVTYKATLDAGANIGSLGNPNTAYLEYNNNPYYEENGKPETGKTPKDKNIVFTYKVVANKVDQNGDSLSGAVFELFKKNSDGVYTSLGVVGAKKDNNGNFIDKDGNVISETDTDKMVADGSTITFEWTGLDDGKYKIVERLAPAGYNRINDMEFTVTADHEILSDDPRLKSLSGNAATGSVIDLEAGKDDNDKLDGSLNTTIVNSSGTELPSTGGMGTTIFYVVGTILVLAAVVLLITKKRMHADK